MIFMRKLVVIYNATDSIRLDALKICLFVLFYHYFGESCKTELNQFKVGFFLAFDRQFRPYGLTSRKRERPISPNVGLTF